MAVKRFNIECGKVRRELFAALVRIYGHDLGDVSPEDLPQVRVFAEHAGRCPECADLGKKLAEAVLVWQKPEKQN